MIGGFLSRAAFGAKNLLGTSSVRQKLLISGGALGATVGINNLIDVQQSNRRAYYGEERYNSMYGDNVESAKTAISAFGLYVGASAILGRDPISRIKNHSSLIFGEGARLRRIINKQRIDRSGLKIQKGPFAGQDLYGPTRSRRANPILEARYNALRKKPKIGLLQGAFYTSLIGTAGGVDHGLGAKIFGGSMIAAAGLGVGYAGKAAGKMLLGTGAEILPNMAALAVGGTAGYMVGSTNNNMMAEGKVTDFMDTGSVVSRMNFSTAGLTLALHRNNRKF